MSADLTAPLDELHGLCHQATVEIRARFMAARRRVARHEFMSSTADGTPGAVVEGAIAVAVGGPDPAATANHLRPRR